MRFPKKHIMAGYLLTLAGLCMLYAFMPFIPEIMWRIEEANAAVQRSAFERAASRFRVERVAHASRQMLRLPEVAITEAKYVEKVNPKPFDVDPAVVDLLKTVSAPVAAEVIAEKDALVLSSKKIAAASKVTSKQAIKSTTKSAVNVSLSSKKQEKTTTGIKVALAVEQPKTKATNVAKEVVTNKQAPTNTKLAKPKGNALMISSVKVNMPLFTGTEKVLERGAWLMPGSANPGEGNTVISGHRYQSFSQNSLYHLDKVHEGDVVVVWWNDKEYRYRVTSNVVVKPEQVDVLNKSSKVKLTLITCDPVFSTKNRRIVVAELIES